MVTRKELRAQIVDTYGISNACVNEFMRMAACINFQVQPRYTIFTDVIIGVGLIKKDKKYYFLSEEGREISEKYFNINEDED